MGKRYRDLIRAYGSEARGNTRAVLNVMADYANDDGICKTGYQTLADDCGVTKRTITNCVQRLIKLGEVEIVDGNRGRGKVTYFHLLIAEKVKEVLPLDAEKVKTVQEKGENGARKGENGASCSIYRNLIEPEQREPRQSATTPAPSPDEDNAEIKASNNYESVYGSPLSEVDFGMNGHAPKPREPVQSEPRATTEQQAMFGALCEAIGADPKTLTGKKRAQIAQTGKTLREAGYSPEDVGTFMISIWFEDWRWLKNSELPRLDQVQDEIGKIHAAVPVNLPDSGRADSTNQMFDNVAAQIRAQMEATGTHYGQP